MKILALCGSIRHNSSNHALLRAVQKLFPHDCSFIEFEIQQLPYFDPELQFSEKLPTPVASLRQHVAECDRIVISTPEYAHGIPGILKNSLEWILCEESMKKQVLVFIASASGGSYVKEYLLETLKTMDLNCTINDVFVVKSARKQITHDGEILDSQLKTDLLEFLKKTATTI